MQPLTRTTRSALFIVLPTTCAHLNQPATDPTSARNLALPYLPLPPFPLSDFAALPAEERGRAAWGMDARAGGLSPLLSHPAIPSASRATRAWLSRDWARGRGGQWATPMPCPQGDASPEEPRVARQEGKRGRPSWLSLHLPSSSRIPAQDTAGAAEWWRSGGGPRVDRGGVFSPLFLLLQQALLACG